MRHFQVSIQSYSQVGQSSGKTPVGAALSRILNDLIILVPFIHTPNQNPLNQKPHAAITYGF